MNFGAASYDGTGPGGIGGRDKNGVQEQGIITINADVENFFITRKGGFGVYQIGGATDTDGGAGEMNLSALSILTGDMLFRQKKNSYVNVQGGGTTATVFSSLTRMPYDPNVSLEDAIEFVGIATSEAMFEAETSYKSGVSAKVTGSGTFAANLGKDTIRCGQMIGIEYPPLDPEGLNDYKKYITSVSNNRGPKRGKIVPSHKAVSISELNDPLGNMVKVLLDNNDVLNVADYNEKQMMGQTLKDPVMEAALEYKQFALYVAFHTIAQLAHSGVFEAFPPGFNLSALISENRIGTNWYDVSNYTNEEQRTQNVNETVAFTRKLAKDLGLARDSSEEIENTVFTQELMYRIFGYASSKAEHTIIAKSITAGDFGVDATRVISSYGHTVPTDNIAGKIHNINRSAVTSVTTAHASFIHRVLRNVIGTSTCLSGPGDRLDFYM